MHLDPVTLPADDHVHSEWSWDAFAGSMVETCARAVELGLPSIAFTEHADFSPWVVPPGVELPERWQPLVHDGVLVPPTLDVTGYLQTLEECRHRFPSLRIVSGVELSEPHWHDDATRDLLRRGGFERVLASVHSGSDASGATTELSVQFEHDPPVEVIRGYLIETARLIEGFDGFEVLAHIDYPVRYWPSSAPAYDPVELEEEHRHVLRLLASSGRVLEVNTRVPLHPQVVTWWREEGGRAVSFASDAHEPAALAAGFAAAAAMVAGAGFRPGRDPHDFWVRA
ncbi:MAG: PHP domain-containing protein [Candidatus Nanopelagicales bacterium]